MRVDVSAKKVLLVDDEAAIRMIGSDALADAGHEVLEAGSADEALGILASAPDVEVLFTDVRMPGSMNGIELARLVHERWPAMKILITSGDTYLRKSEIPDDGRFIGKPYKIEALQIELNHLFD
jgi:DNA-binding NtrC family response regulator